MQTRHHQFERERLAAIVDSSQDAIVSKTIEGIVTSWNVAAERLFGYKAEEMVGKSITVIIPPDRLYEETRILDRLRLGERIVDFETVRLRKDGRQVEVSLTISPLRDESGHIIGASKIARDIGQRKAAERRLRESEERYRSLVEASGVIVFNSDPTARWLTPQPAWEAYTGQAFAQYREHGWADAIHPDDRARVQAITADSIARGVVFEAEGRIWHEPTQTWRHQEARAVPIRDADGRVREWVGTCTDVHARREAQERLRLLQQLGEKLNASLDVDALLGTLIQEALRVVGAEGGMAGVRMPRGMACKKYFRNGTAEPFEYCWPAGHGLPGWLIEHHRPYLTNDAMSDPQIVQDQRRQLGVNCALSVPLLGTEGEAIGFFELHNKPGGFANADGELLLAVSGTASSALQNALSYRKVLIAEEALRASDRRKDEFLAVLAHELRNPLAPIGNSLEILGAEGIERGAAQELTGIAQRQLRHLVRLVDDLMEVSRITRGAIELRREPMLLSAAVQTAVEISQPLMDERKQRLELTLPEQQLLVNGDRTRLTQVIANLLNNASKYSPPGGRIRLTAVRDRHTAVLRVADNGVGIPPDMLSRIFEMFTQVNRSLERAQGGLGIGLSLVRRLVELHGGTVEARSEGRDRGSEFIVRLPLALDAPAHADPPGHAPAVALAPRRVLVADDNRDAARILAVLLRTLGQEVHLAHDGEEAMERAAAVRPELVLLDLGMPRLNGYEVARRIRGEDWGKSTLLVALTGWGQDEDRRRSKESGFDRHLVKPVNVEMLHELLATPAGRAH